MSEPTVFSPCRAYRYTLWRDWSGGLFQNPANPIKPGYIMFIGLNPSTADETKDDPTIRRCIGFCKQWGYLSMCMTNLFAFRSTNPKDMLRHPAPVGVDNDHFLLRLANGAERIIAAWGTNGTHQGRAAEVAKMIRAVRKMECLRLTKGGHPEHPLYVPYSVEPQMF